MAGLSLVGAAAAGLGWQAVHARRMESALAAPHRGHRESVLFRVGRGSTADSIAARLEASGVIADREVFLYGVRERELGARLQAGLYRFAGAVTPTEVIERLAGGRVATRRVTIPEGLDLEETARRLAESGAGEEEALAAFFADPEAARRLVGDLDPAARTLEGYLFPSTYELPPEAAPQVIAGILVGQFRALWNEERRRLAEAADLTIAEAAALASIVEKETGSAGERRRVGSVFRNRLRIGMPLQSDPTVLFAMRRAGDYGNNIRVRDLDIASPYNTYRVRGIPPGPISSFGAAALDAVLDPEETDFLYFVSRNDGTHQFSRSLREHNNAVRRWQKRR